MKISKSDPIFLSLITAGWESLIVINELSDYLDKQQNQGVQDFYKNVADTHFHRHQRDPFNPCTVLMASYISLVLGKEKWEHIIPDVIAWQSPKEWVVCDCEFMDDDYENPTLKHVIRRMRNGIAHGRIEYDIPQNVNSGSKIEALKKTIFTINDERRNQKSQFSINISAYDLWKLSVVFFNKIGNYEIDHPQSKT